MENPNYYSILPANVRYDKNIGFAEKVLYSEITALTNKTGECWASNAYFAALYEVTPQAISKWINKLKIQGYIFISYEYKPNSKEINKRIVRLSDVSTNIDTVSIYDSKVSTNIDTYQQPIKDNTKLIIYINNNKKGCFIFSAYDLKIFEPIRNEIVDFIEFRKSINKPIKTEIQIKSFLNELYTLSENNLINAKLIMQKSISNGWQGIFKLKENEIIQQPKKNQVVCR